MSFSEELIRKMLKLYGASDKEIENFIGDLKQPQQAPSDEFDPDMDGDIDGSN